MYFSAEQVQELEEEHLQLKEKYVNLLTAYSQLKFKNNEAYEYARHGFMRRVGTLQRCIENIYEISPPDREEKPSREECVDLDINLQSFIMNVFGCLDNIAWIWAKEQGLKDKKGQPLSGGHIGLFSSKKNEILRASFSQEFQNYLNGLSAWYKNLENFRHALAHRIPLYVPPCSMTPEEHARDNDLDREKVEAMRRRDFARCEQISAEQRALGKFVPCMTHSYVEETKPIVFHAQVFADWNTIAQMAEEFLKEINRSRETLARDTPNAT